MECDKLGTDPRCLTLTNSASAILNLHQFTYNAASQRTTQTGRQGQTERMITLSKQFAGDRARPRAPVTCFDDPAPAPPPAPPPVRAEEEEEEERSISSFFMRS